MAAAGLNAVLAHPLPQHHYVITSPRPLVKQVFPMPQAPALTQETLAERTAAVAGTALARLLELGRRGCISALWRALFDEADARLTRYEDAVSRGGAHHAVPRTIAFSWGRGGGLC